MTFAFSHLIGAWLVGKGYQLVTKKKIHHYTWFFLLLGSILPDIDYLIDWTLGTNLHRTFTHSITFALFVFIILFSISFFFKEKNMKMFSLALCVGILAHLAIDFVSTQGVPLFWPLGYYFSPFAIYLGKSGTAMLNSSASTLKSLLKLAVLDMGLGTAWIFYLLLKKSIKA